jgi:DNA-binding LacI/PurR family transcriptional regulator
MERRADALGYRLEPMWLRAPGMTYRRFAGVLDARGIQGLLCFGSPALEDEFPRELDHYAVVTQGLSIKSPMHRVVSHVYNDMWRALAKAYELGYRRPGLVIGRYEETRSGHAYVCVYLGWCQLVLKSTSVPVLELDGVEEKPLLQWIDRHEPDVIIFVHHYNRLPEFSQVLKANRLRAPHDFGVIAISQTLENTAFSGLQENQNLIGGWSVELVVSRIMNRDFGLPAHPRIEMVERQWVPGSTLRKA